MKGLKLYIQDMELNLKMMAVACLKRVYGFLSSLKLNGAKNAIKNILKMLQQGKLQQQA